MKRLGKRVWEGHARAVFTDRRAPPKDLLAPKDFATWRPGGRSPWASAIRIQIDPAPESTWKSKAQMGEKAEHIQKDVGSLKMAATPQLGVRWGLATTSGIRQTLTDDRRSFAMVSEVYQIPLQSCAIRFMFLLRCELLQLDGINSDLLNIPYQLSGITTARYSSEG